MLDFLIIATRPSKGVIEVYPKFKVMKSSDLMIRGGDFYAIWNEETQLWCTEEDAALYLIDKELKNYVETHEKNFDGPVRILYMWDSDTGMIDKWHKYVQKQSRDNFSPLDTKLIFANTQTKKTDYASKRLPYPLEQSKIEAYDELIGTLYDPEERHKIEWAIGAIVSGESKLLQKFMVLYGSAGTGKSTILNIIQSLFDGYYCVFDAKALGMNANAFALESFKSNPLVAIQHDGDLSRIEDNTRLNSIVSHELMTVNEKFRSAYASRFGCFLFVGTNRPVKITDAKSGIIRRLIDVSPSGRRLAPDKYKRIVSQVGFELGGIAYHCREVFLADPGAYDNYVPTAMMGASNDFYNFILDSFDIFRKEDGVSLKIAWEMYKTYCEDAKVGYPLSLRLFKEELKNYFEDFQERGHGSDGTRTWNYYSGFLTDKFQVSEPVKSEDDDTWLKFNCTTSLFDTLAGDYPAQYASQKGTPLKSWDDVTTSLKSLDTHRLHYVLIPDICHIVVDFDLKDEAGNKSFELNHKAAEKWPKTYAELSKSGQGIHLHYIFEGDASKLSRLYDEDIEVKVFTGKSSLRRMLTKCNDIPIAPIHGGLPTKGDDRVIDFDGIKSERHLRRLIEKNLRKEIHPATKPSIDMIFKVLEDAYDSGMQYDVSDLAPHIQAFACNSTNQAEKCLKIACKMHFHSEPQEELAPVPYPEDGGSFVFFDIEVFPNLLLVVFAIGDADPITCINPTPQFIESMMRSKLIGFNNRKYDNHILYARMLGYDNAQIYDVSRRIIAKDKDAFFGSAYNLSYTDIHDFSSKKQSLKRWEIEMGIHHQELGLPWDQPVPEERWQEVADYCKNDVVATRALFYHLKGDWEARQMLAAMAGMTVNDTTNTLTTRFIFGTERHPALVYTDLATGKTSDPAYQRTDIKTAFPGYEHVGGKNMYRGEDVGYGGYVYAEPGMYTYAVTFDVASMHPSSAIAMNYFGKYTVRFQEILNARIAIKHKDFDAARSMLGGALAPYLDDPSTAKMVAQALKIAINSVYGLTSAKFDNPFRDARNTNNIVALRGALFMVNLKHEVQQRGFRVIHIKTDSIKIENPSKDICDFVMAYGKEYGYNFEIEHVFEKICLVNNAVYIAKLSENDDEWIGEAKAAKEKGLPEPTRWTATGAQFAQSYVFKHCFSKEPIQFEDMCETKTVTSSMYLDMNESLESPIPYEAELEKAMRKFAYDRITEAEMIDIRNRLEPKIAAGHNYKFVGRAGLFCPIKPGCGGGILVRETDGKYDAVVGTKGYRWLEAETVEALNKHDDIDIGYHRELVDAAIDSISKFGDYEAFISDDFAAPPF